MNLRLLFLLSCFCILLPCLSFAQYQPVDPLYRDWTRQKSGVDSIVAGTGYWPLDPLTASKLIPKDTLTGSGLFNGKSRPMLWQYHSNDLNFSVIPWVDFAYGKGNNGYSEHEDVRGLKISGELDKKLLFGALYYENNTLLPGWINNTANHKNFVPQEGLGVSVKNGSWDVSATEAWLQYLCSNHFSVIAGYGRQFIGYGYRSLLLDDATSNYPYLRLDWHSGPWRYEVSYNQFLNPQTQINYSYMSSSYQRKDNVIHYLSFAPSKNIEIGLFESIIWVADDSFYNRGVELQYLNPIIFLHKAGYALGSPDNDLIGAQATWKIANVLNLYSQLIIDDFNVTQTISHHEMNLNDKYAFQLGISKQKLFNNDGLSTRLEWNSARPFIYGERAVALNYSHGYQSLADPLGANFDEFIFQLNYKGKKFYGLFEQLFALQGKDQPGFLSGQNLWGGEANVPFYGDYTLQGRKCSLSYTSFTLGYILNEANQLSVELSAGYRAYKEAAIPSAPELIQNQLYVQMGLKSLFISRYRDY